ncbi:MAG: metallophosphoesterase [Nitrososphaeraceae archaeon]|nr:metallophosphoesterase [Nitrososphaeraceae archaeon]
MMKIYYNIAIIAYPIITISLICMLLLLSRYAIAQEKEFNFVAVGDLDCNVNSNQTINNIIDKKPELFLALGDMYYDCKPDEFKKAFSSLHDIMYMAIGNHDSWSKFAGLYHLPNDKPYYSFDKENVHFLFLSTESDLQQNSTQYEFVNTDLDIASQNRSISWIVVLAHRPFISSETKNISEKDNLKIYPPLFAKYGVDVVIQAHVHNYQRTFPILLDSLTNPMIVTTNTTINEGTGVSYFTTGGGGHDLYEFQSKSPYVQTQYAEYGILNVDLNETALTLKAYTNKDFRTPKDTFTILKAIDNTKPTPILKYLYINTTKGNVTIPTQKGLIEIPIENGTARLPVEYNYFSPH